MIKLIISDMDGTLLNSHLRISLENQEAIRKATQKGVLFAIATGRHISEARPILSASQISCPIITGNGSAVYDQDGHLQHVYALSTERTLDLLKQIKQFPTLHVELTTIEHVLCEDASSREKVLCDFIKLHHPNITDSEMATILDQQKIDSPVVIVPSLIAYVQQAKPNTLLKLLIVNTQRNDAIHQLRQQLDSLDDIAISSSYADNLEINAHSATKGNAVKQLADSFALPLTDVMAIGDNLNDVSMLAVVGTSVAMGNGHPSVKELASDITDTADNHGVAKAILKYIEQ